jgi:RNA polymerase sigma-54 factor
MKQGLQLKFSQQLAMTPQLQQAIRLLQLSSIELQQEIHAALESNPLLELDDHYDEIKTAETKEQDNLDSSDALEQNEIPEELPIDANWDEIYTANSSSANSSDYSSNELPVYQGETAHNLHEHLMWQVNLTRFSEIDNAIAVAIVEAIDEAGYLTQSLEEIHDSLANPEITPEEIEVVLKRIQHFDPIGVAARSLQECLKIQLQQLPKSVPFRDEALLVVVNYLDLLGNHDFKSLMKLSKLKEETIRNVILLIQTLDPKPGHSVHTEETDYVIPDIFVKKRGSRWVVELNNEWMPHLKINQHYAQLANSQNSSDNQFIRNNLQEAKWLIKSLESRNDTLLKVSQCIVEQQQPFFELGEEYMKPMILADIASQVEMHESTISRVTTQKYLHCPRGVFELKYFFSSHINTESGGEASSTAIRAMIKKLIAAENPKKPLSDSKIVDLLSEQGMIVARRTVAKYRESLSIPSSSQRKSLI